VQEGQTFSAAEENIDICIYMYYLSVGANNRKKYFNETKIVDVGLSR
jgi:hypothetical protein